MYKMCVYMTLTKIMYELVHSSPLQDNELYD